MKTIIRLIAILGTLALSSTAFALSLSPGDPHFEGSDPNNPNAYDVECIVGGSGATYDGPPPPTGDFNGWDMDCGGNLALLYKKDTDGELDGAFADDYITTFAPTDEEAEDATIVWLESDAIQCSPDWPCYLLVKGGVQSPIWYLFDISGWDGEDTINLTGFWPDNGAISHVSIFGHAVPEPGTLALLGLGLFAMGLMRRRRAS